MLPVTINLVDYREIELAISETYISTIVTSFKLSLTNILNKTHRCKCREKK